MVINISQPLYNAWLVSKLLAEKFAHCESTAFIKTHTMENMGRYITRND